MTHKDKPYIYKRSEEDGRKYAYKNEAYWKDLSQKKYDILLKRSGIPEFYWHIGFKDYKGTKSKDALQNAITYSHSFFTDKFKFAHLYIWSEMNSSQKTAIACNIGKEAIKQGYTVRFVLAGVLIDNLLKLSGFNYNETIDSYIKDLKESDMLIIDDIFDSKKAIQWKASDLIVAEIDKFFREVLVSNLKLILTSNISFLNLEKNYGKSMSELISRNFVPLEFNDSIKEAKIKKFDNIWEADVNEEK